MLQIEAVRKAVRSKDESSITRWWSFPGEETKELKRGVRDKKLVRRVAIAWQLRPAQHFAGWRSWALP